MAVLNSIACIGYVHNFSVSIQLIDTYIDGFHDLCAKYYDVLMCSSLRNDPRLVCWVVQLRVLFLVS